MQAGAGKGEILMITNILKKIKHIAVAGVLLPAAICASGAGDGAALDRAPVSMDPVRLQSGAKFFINYCMNCHSASFVRYNTLEKIGLTPEEIEGKLIFTGQKVGELMTTAMRPADAKRWFGVRPPDLSLVARARASGQGSGADWLYTYLRGFYHDSERQTGWNNTVFSNVGMPHALWELQGTQVAKTVTAADGTEHLELSLAKPGKMTVEQYDEAVADLVSFLVWIGEPGAEKRKMIGYFVLIFLAGFFVLAYALKKDYWKDVH